MVYWSNIPTLINYEERKTTVIHKEQWFHEAQLFGSRSNTPLFHLHHNINLTDRWVRTVFPYIPTSTLSCFPTDNSHRQQQQHFLLPVFPLCVMNHSIKARHWWEDEKHIWAHMFKDQQVWFYYDLVFLSAWHIITKKHLQYIFQVLSYVISRLSLQKATLITHHTDSTVG